MEAALAAAASRPTPGMPVIVGDFGARRALDRICERLDGISVPGRSTP
jgi:hypothetical protein